MIPEIEIKQLCKYGKQTLLRRRWSYSDAEDISQQAIQKFIDHYDPVKGMSKKSYYFLWIRAIAFQTSTKYKKEKAKIEAYQNHNLGYTKDESGKIESMEIFRYLLSLLSVEIAKILWLHYWEGWSIREISRTRGCSRTWIYRLASQGKKELRKMIEKNNIKGVVAL